VSVFSDPIIVFPDDGVILFLSGLILEFVPTGWAERHLGGKGIKPLLYSALVGTIVSFTNTMYITVGKGTASLEFRHWHQKPDIGVGVGGGKSNSTEVYHLSILLHPE
jgi:hypothetical protein